MEAAIEGQHKTLELLIEAWADLNVEANVRLRQGGFGLG